MNYQHFASWQNQRRLISLVVGAVFLLTVFPAFAKFKPRDRKPASGYSSAGGKRGCGKKVDIPLTQLAPWTFIGKTTSTRPMLVWYMSSTETVRFRLFEFDSANTLRGIGQVKEIPATVGINKLKLPLDYPELTVGKTYLWQIAIDCDNNIPIIRRAEFTVVNPQSLPQKRFTSIPENVNYYAENELWYEAFEEALKSSSNSQLGQIGSDLVKDLAQSEMEVGRDLGMKDIQQRVKDLEQIASESK